MRSGSSARSSLAQASELKDRAAALTPVEDFMEYESIKAGDKAMERCLGGCLRSLRATTKVIAKLEHLSGIKGFTRSMIALIGETFEKGPGNIFKSGKPSQANVFCGGNVIFFSSDQAQ